MNFNYGMLRIIMNTLSHFFSILFQIDEQNQNNKFEFFTEFFYIVSVLYFYSTLITTNFNVLKYIKKIFKISI